MTRHAQPTIQATVRADGTGLVSIDGQTVAVKAADMAEAGRRAIALAADRAAAAGRPLPLTAHSPEGTRRLTVHPDGRLTEGGPPRRKRPMAVLAAVVAAGLALGGAGALAAFHDRTGDGAAGPGTGTATARHASATPPPAVAGGNDAPAASDPNPAAALTPEDAGEGDQPASDIPPAQAPTTEPHAEDRTGPVASATPTATAKAKPGRRAGVKPNHPTAAPRPPAAPAPTHRPPTPSGFYWN